MAETDFPLENHRVIFAFIQRNPGLHMRKISDRLDMHLSTLRYHLDYLEERGFISSSQEKNLKVFFVRKMKKKMKAIAPLLQQERFRSIILTIFRFPGISPSGISTELLNKPSTLSKYLGLLTDRGIIEFRKAGRQKKFHIVDEDDIVELLITYKKTFWDKLVDNVLDIYFER